MKIEIRLEIGIPNNTNAFIVIDLLLIPGSKSLSPDGQKKVERQDKILQSLESLQ